MQRMMSYHVFVWKKDQRLNKYLNKYLRLAGCEYTTQL